MTEYVERMPPIEAARMDEAQQAAAAELIAGPAKPSPDLSLHCSGVRS